MSISTYSLASSYQEKFALKNTINYLLNDLNQTAEESTVSEKIAALESTLESSLATDKRIQSLIKQNLTKSLEGQKLGWIYTPTGRKTHKVLNVATVFSWIGLIATAIQDAADRPERSSGPLITALITAGLTAATAIGNDLYEKLQKKADSEELMNEKKKQREILSNLSSLFIEFSKTIVENQNKELENRTQHEKVVEKKLEAFLDGLKAYPEKYEQQLPKERWLSFVLPLLPESNDLKKKALKINEIAMNMYLERPSLDNSSIASTLQGSVDLTEPIFAIDDANIQPLFHSQEENNSINEAKSIQQTSYESRKNPLLRSSLIRKQSNSQRLVYKEQYEASWRDFEKRIKFPLNSLKFNERLFTSQGLSLNQSQSSHHSIDIGIRSDSNHEGEEKNGNDEKNSIRKNQQLPLPLIDPNNQQSDIEGEWDLINDQSNDKP